jgi:hydrogenase nickel incorporation protein HypB
MDIIKTIEVKRSILEDNDADAQKLRKELEGAGIYYINLMSAPGSGKTSVLVKVINALKDKCKIGVMEADIDSDVDAHTIARYGAEAIQLHTGGMCHLDADMSRQGFREFATKAEMVFLENVGNLVCPAEFDTGAFLKVMILSVTEGDDKPLKYPLMFSVVDAVIINKIDTMEYFDFNLARCREYIAKENPKALVFPVSAKTGEGIPELSRWMYGKMLEWKESI